MPLSELAAPAIAHARDGVEVNRPQALLWDMLSPIAVATVESRARYCVDGRVPREGDVVRDPELAEGISRLATDGAAPFYTGDIGAAVSEWVIARGGTLTRDDLAGYEAIAREPVRVRYHGREVLTNPPPSAGGVLLAYALALLERSPGKPDAAQLVDAMEAAQAERTPAFLDHLHEPAFLETFMASRLGSTTHVSVLDADGWACAVTTTNGEGSGIVVPGTGIHVNNMMGEQDLSPAGFFTHPPGRRLPSMMAPTVVLDDGSPELVLGSAGSNRIRSAILQVIVNAIDHGMEAQAAVDAPRLHFEDNLVYAEPGHRRGGAQGPLDRLVPRAQPLLRRLPGRRAPPRDARVQRRAAIRVGAARSFARDLDHLRHVGRVQRALQQVGARLLERVGVAAARLQPR